MQRFAALVALAGVSIAASSSFGAHTRKWDWKGNNRTINISFDVTADLSFVNRVPGFEPDPTPGDAFSISDSVRRGSGAWNAALGGMWNLNTGVGVVGAPELTIRMGGIVGDGMGGTMNEFAPPGSEDADIDADDSGGPGGGGGPSNTLAFFRILTRDAADPFFVTSAEIVFNNFADWGISANEAVRTGFPRRYDPIITALHELGHSMRLEHGVGTIDGIVDDVMSPKIQSGWHQLNAFVNPAYDRNPDAMSVMMAKRSAMDQVPTPGVVGALGLAGVFASRRRR